MAPKKKQVREADLKLAVYSVIAPSRPHTLQEISEVMGVTRERVRQLEAQALRKLRFHVQNILKHDSITSEDIINLLTER